MWRAFCRYIHQENKMLYKKSSVQLILSHDITVELTIHIPPKHKHLGNPPDCTLLWAEFKQKQGEGDKRWKPCQIWIYIHTPRDTWQRLQPWNGECIKQGIKAELGEAYSESLRGRPSYLWKMWPWFKSYRSDYWTAWGAKNLGMLEAQPRSSLR